MKKSDRFDWKRSRYLSFFILYFFIFSVHQMNAQNQQVSGTITGSEDGQPVVGATILVKGTINGTISNTNGEYSINVASNATLAISSIGYQDQEISVGNRSTIDVILEIDVLSLDEVVVIGYGSIKKANLTGSVVTINSDELIKRPITNVAAMLQGKMPGLSVVQGSGEPGGERVELTIRGNGTFSAAGSAPLVIVDGVPGSLESIDPNDIANITVLKDAASAAIYGSRAANGVILVETKKGVAGKPSFNYRVSYGVLEPTNRLDLITNSADFMELWNEAKTNTGVGPLIPQSTIDAYRNATDREQYPNTDWQDIMVGQGSLLRHHLNFSGGTEKTVYNVSLGYADEKGLSKAYSSTYYSTLINLESQINDWLKFGAKLSGKFKNRDSEGGAGSIIDNEWTWFQPPMYSPTLPDGSGRYSASSIGGSVNGYNPVAFAETNKSKEKQYNYQTMGWVEITPLKNLVWQTKLAVDGWNTNSSHRVGKAELYDFHTHDYLFDLSANNSLDARIIQSFTPVLFSTLSYSNTFSGKHNVNAMVGYSQESFRDEYIRGYREGFPNNELSQLSAGSADVQFNWGSASEYAIRSLFGRLNYNFSEKYLVEANVRYDATSRLPEGNRAGFFPSVSAGWKISEEQFMQNVEIVDYMKIRASYGTLGNQNIGNYPYQDMVSLIGNYPFGSSTSSGAKYEALSNRNLKWEETTVKDIGIDFGFFKSKLSGSVDVFEKITTDILRTQQVSGIVGLTGPTINSGEVKNTGMEFELYYQDQVGDFRYDVGTNFSTFKNELVSFGEREISGYEIWQEGYPINSFYMLEWIGIFQDQGEIDANPEQRFDPRPGDLKFKDQNGDGVVDSDDRVIMDGQYPGYEYSFHLNLSWKNFDVSAFLLGIEGKKYYGKKTGIQPFYQGTSLTKDWENRWTTSNPSTTMPYIYITESLEIMEQVSSYFLHDASYLRLKNVQIGYTLPKSLTQKMKINTLRIFLSGDNLLTFSDYPGLDPEGSRKDWAEQSLGYPQNKVYTFGLNVNF